jgi:glycosyltransferase involved in cell wall biosynthesis
VVRRTVRSRWFFSLNALLIVVLVTYKIYLNFFEQDFAAVHAEQVERIEARLADREHYRFAVVGNINNSVGIFERKIIPMLNRSGVDFVISAGNAVNSGGEDKYRALNRTLDNLQMPYLLTFGENEHSRLGSFRFYDHYGPYLFSFTGGGDHFVFLDSTGKTDYQWQQRWLEEEITDRGEQRVFVFSAHPLKEVGSHGLLSLDNDYLLPDTMRSRLASIIEAAGVEAVFSTGLPLYSEQRHGHTRYLVTGGAGGLVLNNEHSYYHYVEVTVDGKDVLIKPVQLDIGQHPLWRTLESLWFFLHSLFYVDYLNFILLISALIAIAMWIHARVLADRDYYPEFDIDTLAYQHRRLKVTMFTNNYLPFIGGVPISIDRLRRVLNQLGHQVLVVAPCYHNAPSETAGELRVRSLRSPGGGKAFRLANIFSPRLYRQVFAFRPDIIHVHHPFWLGSAGLWLGRLLRVPVVYTYHTRLEHYAHYVPLPGPLFRNLISHALVKRFANSCDAVVVPTEAAEEYLRMIGVKRPIFVLPTGIEYEHFQAVSEQAVAELRKELKIGSEKVLISISRLSREKNIDFMLEAVHELVLRNPVPFKLLIIGDGEDRKRLQARIFQLGLEARVLLLGAVPPQDIPRYCRLGDLFVFASRSETQGMVILEAMAAGLPAVVVRASGIDDMVHDGENGFKTLPIRSRWVSCVEQLLLEEPLRQRLSENASAFARSYDVDSFGNQMEQIYAHVLAVRARRDARQDG